MFHTGRSSSVFIRFIGWLSLMIFHLFYNHLIGISYHILRPKIFLKILISSATQCFWVRNNSGVYIYKSTPSCGLCESPPNICIETGRFTRCFFPCGLICPLFVAPSRCCRRGLEGGLPAVLSLVKLTPKDRAGLEALRFLACTEASCGSQERLRLRV